jgi:hypothetical protein
LVETEEGKQLADELLEKGYAKIDQKRARLYVEAQIAILDTEQNTYIPAAWESNDPLASLTNTSTVDNDYDLDELSDIDIAPPAQLQASENTAKLGLIERARNIIGL